MGSKALEGLLSGLAEIDAMQRANPTPEQGGGLTKPEITRALGRAEVVLLSSHFERYLYALNEEVCALVTAAGVSAEQLPAEVRLLHSQSFVDELAKTQWDRRADGLRAYSELEAWIWRDDEPIRSLDPDRLLSWMKAPNCRSVLRLFRIWGVPDIFTAITRKAVNRQRLWMRLGELVEKRNNIAHGDLTVEARYLDVVQYRAAVTKFCTSADTRMGATMARLVQGNRPW